MAELQVLLLRETWSGYVVLARGTRGRPSPRAKWGQVPPEERQQNAEEAHRARGAPRGALPEKTGICRRLTRK